MDQPRAQSAYWQSGTETNPKQDIFAWSRLWPSHLAIVLTGKSCARFWCCLRGTSNILPWAKRSPLRMMTSFTLCTFISLIYTHLLACGHPYVPLLPVYYLFLDFCSKSRVIGSPKALILARRQKGHAFARAGGFIAAAGHYIYFMLTVDSLC